MRIIITLAALLIFSSGYLINESFAEVSENQAFLLEGSGFAVNEEHIRISAIDLGLTSQQQRGSTIDFLTESGFVTLDDEEFIISELKGKFLREGRYIRINGDIESSTGFDTSISFFGRIIEESKNATVYGFTGRITTPDDTYKIIYTTKLDTLSKITTTITPTKESNDLTIHVLKDAHLQNAGRYFSNSLFSTNYGIPITIINDDTVSHKFISVISHFSPSGSKNYNDVVICDLGEVILPQSNKYSSQATLCDYNKDERINTNEILPGESITINLEDLGNYRIIDPDYPWMEIVLHVFPNSNNLIFK